MPVSELIGAVASVGFPIVCCVAMMYYVKYLTDKHIEETKELNKQHSDEMATFKDEVKEALNNNTIAITKLCEKLEKGVDFNGKDE